jgi:4,5-DOPA dioxygenase extradiol
MNERQDIAQVTRRNFLSTALGVAITGTILPVATWGTGCSPPGPTRGGAALEGAGAQAGEGQGATKSDSTAMPLGFVGHGAPTLAIDPGKGGDLTRWARNMPRPRAILAVSAHWEDTPATAGTIRMRELLYDFYNFPKELYELEYPAPGAPELARRLDSLIPGGVKQQDRAWDHGVWVPLIHMAPDADIPVLQLSLPSHAGPQALFDLGRKLAALQDEGVFILGSGNIVHNLRRLDWAQGPPPSWATEFDHWARETLAGQDFDALVDYRQKSPALRVAHPTEEHFQPLLVVAGAASARGSDASFPVEGFEYGSISRRCVQFG